MRRTVVIEAAAQVRYDANRLHERATEKERALNGRSMGMREGTFASAKVRARAMTSGPAIVSPIDA